MPGRCAPHLRHQRGQCLIGRRLYFTKEWATDEERRELTGVPDEPCFATKPQLTADMLHAVGRQGISASFFLGDEVYGGRELRTTCRELGLGYVVGVRSNHQVTTPAAKLSVAQAAARLPKRARHRMRTGAALSARFAREIRLARVVSLIPRSFATSGDRLPGLRHDAYRPLTKLRRERATLLRHDNQHPLLSRTPRYKGSLILPDTKPGESVRLSGAQEEDLVGAAGQPGHDLGGVAWGRSLGCRPI